MRPVAWGCALMLSVAPLAAASPVPATAGVERLELEGGARAWQLSLGRPIVDWTPSCRASSSPPRSCDLVLLLAGDADAPDVGATPRGRSLLRFRRDEASVESLFELEDPASGVVALDLDGDGDDELVVATVSGLWRVDPGGRPSLHLLIDEPGLDLELVEPLLRRGDPLVAIPTVGRLLLFEAEGGLLRPLGQIELPLTIERREDGLRLRSPPVARPAGPVRAFLVGPEVVGRQRLRVLRAAPDEAGIWQREERWAQLPDPEEVDEARWAFPGGRETLLVHTLDADRVGIFERKKLRVVLPEVDRTRSGSEPVWADATASRIWQELGSRLADLDGDGVPELLVFQREGFDGRQLLVDVYRGVESADGLAFESRRSRTQLSESWPAWRFDDDFSGDGRPDLLVLAGELVLYESRGPVRRRDGFFAEPGRWRITLPESSATEGSPLEAFDPPEDFEGPEPEELDEDEAEELRWRSPTVVDLEGDGRPEVVLELRRTRDQLLLIEPPGDP